MLLMGGRHSEWNRALRRRDAPEPNRYLQPKDPQIW